jgi:hypothetical protein
MGKVWSNDGGKNHDLTPGTAKSNGPVTSDQLSEVEISILKKLEAVEERLSALLTDGNRNTNKD